MPGVRPLEPYFLVPSVRCPAPTTIPATLSPALSYLARKPTASVRPLNPSPTISAPACRPGHRTTHFSHHSQTASPLENGTPSASCQVFSTKASQTRFVPCPTRDK